MLWPHTNPAHQIRFNILTVMSLSTRSLYQIMAVVCLSLTAGQTDARAELVSVNTITNNANTIGVFFNPAVTLPSATNPANYTVFTKTGAVSVLSVSLKTNGQFVALNLAAKIVDFFSVGVSNIVDVAANTNNATVLGYISDYGSTDIGIAGNPNPTGQVFTVHRDTFETIAGGSGVGSTNDFFHFIYQQVVSNFDMAVMVTRLDAADPRSQAGLMARETLAKDSRTLQTYFTPTTGSNEVEVAVRSAIAGPTTDAGFQIGLRAAASSNSWLRLTRSNNTFTAYYGTNGYDWNPSGTTTQTFASTLYIGMMVASHTTNGTATTAGFNSFEFSAARPGDGIVPTLNASLSGTNLLLTWQNPFRDYTVEVSTNLTDWGILLATIYQTGTNGTGRSMLVPLEMWDRPVFMRLIRVFRVIPDAAFILDTGLLLALSQGDGAMSYTLPGNTLCGPTVNTASAITQVGGQMPSVPGYIATFSTGASEPSLDTVLQVRKVLATSCNDDFGGIQSQIALSTSPKNSTFSFVAAVKANQSTDATHKIVVTITVK